MSPSGRVAFIEKIRKALNRGDAAERSLEALIRNQPDADDARLLDAIAARNDTSRKALLERLAEAAKSANVTILIEKDADSAAASISPPRRFTRFRAKS